MERMRNTQCIQNVSLGCLCYSHEVEKTERLRVCKVKISIRKRPHVTRNCVLHKVVWFLFFLGFSQDITFYPLEDMWGYPEITMRRGKVPYSQKGKILHSLNLSKYFFFSQFCPYLFLSRSFLFSLIFSEFGQSALTVWELNLRLRVSHFFSLFPSLITVIGALEIHKLITVKSPEIKGNKRIWDTRE